MQNKSGIVYGIFGRYLSHEVAMGALRSEYPTRYLCFCIAEMPTRDLFLGGPRDC